MEQLKVFRKGMENMARLADGKLNNRHLFAFRKYFERVTLNTFLAPLEIFILITASVWFKNSHHHF